jgi:hypothetical protein
MVMATHGVVSTLDRVPPYDPVFCSAITLILSKE